jgi:hypothetical protein
MQRPEDGILGQGTSQVDQILDLGRRLDGAHLTRTLLMLLLLLHGKRRQRGLVLTAAGVLGTERHAVGGVGLPLLLVHDVALLLLLLLQHDLLLVVHVVVVKG